MPGYRAHACLLASLLVATLSLPALGLQNRSRPAPDDQLQALLSLYGLRSEVLAEFTDGVPVKAAEEPSLLRILYVLRRVPAGELADAATTEPDWTAIRSIPAAHRGEAMRLRGKLQSIAPVVMLAELRDRFELDDLFKCEIEVPLIGPVVVYTSVVPSALREAPLPQTVEAAGLFLKWTEIGEDFVPVVAAGRLAWFPENLLGQLGMDAGLLDDVVQRRGLSVAEIEPFYSLLAAADRLSVRDPVALSITAENDAAVVALFQDPQQYVGQLISVRGTARRAIPIRVQDPAVRQRFAIDEYYEIEVFLRVDRLKPELNPLVFVFCVRELPEGMSPGDGLHLPVEARGIFLKLWTYESQYAREVGSELRQIAPLAIGHTVELTTPGTAAQRATPVLLSLAIGTVAAVGLVVWWLGRNDRRRRQRGTGTQAEWDDLHETA